MRLELTEPSTIRELHHVLAPKHWLKNLPAAVHLIALRARIPWWATCLIRTTGTKRHIQRLASDVAKLTLNSCGQSSPGRRLLR